MTILLMSAAVLGLLILPQECTWAQRYWGAFHFVASIAVAVYVVTLIFLVRRRPPTFAWRVEACLLAGLIAAAIVVVPGIALVKTRTFVDPHLSAQLAGSAGYLLVYCWLFGARSLTLRWTRRTPPFPTVEIERGTLDSRAMVFAAWVTLVMMSNFYEAAYRYQETWYDGVLCIWMFSGRDAYRLLYILVAVNIASLLVPLCGRGWTRKPWVLTVVGIMNAAPWVVSGRFRE